MRFKELLNRINKVLQVIEDEIILMSKQFFNFLRMNGGGQKWNKKKLKKVLLNAFLALVAFLFFAFGGILLWFSSIEIPDLASFDQRILGQSTKIFDKTGQTLLYDLSKNMRRTVVPFDQISQNIKNATIAIEDKEFYNHHGINLSSLMRAALANISSFEYSQGGSTITQQVVKNSLLTREKTITRKVKEIFLALKLEKTLTKDQILNLYLNESPYGGVVYGIEEASVVYFNKEASELSIAESAYLAAIPKSPTRYSPFGSHRDELDARKNLTLLKMKEVGFITEEEYRNAKEEVVEFNEELSGGIKAPHFVMFIKEYLEEEYGEELLMEGGLKITTTLDYEMQKTAEEILKRKALENDKLYHATNAALVAIDAKTGQILTMVGSRDYFDEEIPGNYNVATAKRQPGSSFKPFVYAKAFEMGYTPETILFDLETQFSTACDVSNTSSVDPCYSPGNYDGSFRGPMTIRNALAQSINIPAVKALYLVGVNNAIDLAEKMGISTLKDRSRFGLSLVLGGGEVTLLDMTSAYSVFADNGNRHPYTGILKIEDKMGKVLEEFEEDSEVVLEENTTRQISDILSDNVARTPIFGASSSLYFPDRQVAAKTGTTNNYRDAWVIGYTPQISVGAWAGNNDNTPIDRKVAGYIVAPMWHEFMNEILKTIPDERFPKPEQKDTKDLKPVLRGVWQGEGGVHSILYWLNKEDPLGKPLKNPYDDPQLVYWEYPIQKWVQGQGINSGSVDPNSVNSINNKIKVEILSPKNGQIIKNGTTINATVKVISDTPIKKVDYFLEGMFLGSSEYSPYSLSFNLDSSKGVIGQNTLRVVVTDTTGAQQGTYTIFEKR